MHLSGLKAWFYSDFKVRKKCILLNVASRKKKVQEKNGR